MYDNFIIPWWVLQKKVYWKRQTIKNIVLSSVIQYHEIFFHPNLIIWPLDTKLCVSASVAYLSKSYIHNYYHGVRVFEKLQDQSCNSQNRRSGKISNCFYKIYKILSFYMGSICFRQHLTWQWQQYVNIRHQNIHYHILKWFCVVLHNVHGFIFQVQNHINIILMLAQSYYLMSINK